MKARAARRAGAAAYNSSVTNRSVTRRSDFPARLSALPDVAAFIAETCRAAGIEADLRLTLLVEELFTNTIVHGHRRESDERVHLELDVEPGRIGLTYEDTAPPHDPFAGVEPPDETAGVDERPVGGLGLLLVAAMARDVEYSRVEGRNRIRLAVAAPVA